MVFVLVCVAARLNATGASQIGVARCGLIGSGVWEDLKGENKIEVSDTIRCECHSIVGSLASVNCNG